MLIRCSDGIWRQEAPEGVEYDPLVVRPHLGPKPNGSYVFEPVYSQRKRQAEAWIELNERLKADA